MNHTPGICRHCGKNSSTEKKPNQTQCNSCQVSKRRHKRKNECIEYKGGVCQECGWGKHAHDFNPAGLSFHHRDPSKKKFELNANKLLLKWETVKKELDKCDMLCLRCHAVLEAKDNRVYID